MQLKKFFPTLLVAIVCMAACSEKNTPSGPGKHEDNPDDPPVVTKFDTLTCAQAAEKRTSTDTVVVIGYATKVFDPSLSTKTGDIQQIAWMADDSTATQGIVEAYYCTITDTIQAGDKVEVKGLLSVFTNASGTEVVEIKNGKMKKLSGSAGGRTVTPIKIDTTNALTCAEALPLVGTAGEVVVIGYVITPYAVSQGQQSAWLADSVSAPEGVLEAYYCDVETAVSKGDRVAVQGMLTLYTDKSGKQIVEIKNGKMVILEKATVTPTPPVGDHLWIETFGASVSQVSSKWPYADKYTGYDHQNDMTVTSQNVDIRQTSTLSPHAWFPANKDCSLTLAGLPKGDVLSLKIAANAGNVSSDLLTVYCDTCKVAFTAQTITTKNTFVTISAAIQPTDSVWTLKLVTAGSTNTVGVRVDDIAIDKKE